MKIFISVSATKLKNVPKGAIPYKAKSSVLVEDAAHESSIKRGETFHLYQSTAGFFLFDFDEESGFYYKFSLTKAKFNKIRKEHTELADKSSKSNPSKSKVRTRESGYKAAARLAEKTKQATSLLGRVGSTLAAHRQQQQDLLDGLQKHELLQRVAIAQKNINRILLTIQDYIDSDVVFTESTESFIDAMKELIDGYDARKSEERSVRQAWLLEQIQLIEKTFNIDFSGNPVQNLQKTKHISSVKAPGKILQFKPKTRD